MSSLQKNIIVIMSVKMRMALLLADRTAAQYDGLCGMMLSSVCLSVCMSVTLWMVWINDASYNQVSK